MNQRIVQRMRGFMNTGLVLTFALAVALGGVTMGSGSVYADGEPTGGYVGGPPLSVAQQHQIANKEVAVSAWLAASSAYSPSAINHSVSVQTSRNTVSRYCVVNPSTGQCTYWVTVSLGGAWTTEPHDQPNWCGPGAATAVAAHWNNSAVVNHSSVWVTADPSWGGGQVELYNAQAWMGWFAQHLYVDRQSGVEPSGTTAASTGVMRDGLNSALSTGGYYITLGSSNIPQESNLYGNATYDIGHDGHPMIFLVDAIYLQEWPYKTWPINHYIEGYGYGYWYGASSNSSNKIYYADSASPSDYGTAGDYSTTYDDFWNHPWLGKGYANQNS